MTIQLRDFQPVNTWKPNVNGPGWKNQPGIPAFLTDVSTGKQYLNETTELVRFKCFLLLFGTPIIHAIAGVINVADKTLKLISFHHFLKSGDQSLKERITDAGADLFRIAATPIAYIALELAALYGLFRPYDGRKLYASIERAIYKRPILAPCFQPNAKYHLLGGDITKAGQI